MPCHLLQAANFWHQTCIATIGKQNSSLLVETLKRLAAILNVIMRYNCNAWAAVACDTCLAALLSQAGQAGPVCCILEKLRNQAGAVT